MQSESCLMLDVEVPDQVAESNYRNFQASSLGSRGGIKEGDSLLGIGKNLLKEAKSKCI